MVYTQECIVFRFERSCEELRYGRLLFSFTALMKRQRKIVISLCGWRHRNLRILVGRRLIYPSYKTTGCCGFLHSSYHIPLNFSRLVKEYDHPPQRPTNWPIPRQILRRQKHRADNCMRLYQIRHRSSLHPLGSRCRNSLRLSTTSVFRSEQNELQTILVFFFTIPFRIALLHLAIRLPQFLLILADYQDANFTFIETPQRIDVRVGILSSSGWCN